jgi:phosphoserine aminotransferase
MNVPFTLHHFDDAFLKQAKSCGLIQLKDTAQSAACVSTYNAMPLEGVYQVFMKEFADRHA